MTKKINSRLQPCQLDYSSEPVFLHCLAYSVLFLLRNRANIEYKGPIPLVCNTNPSDPIPTERSPLAQSQRRCFCFNTCLCLLSTQILHTLNVQAFFPQVPWKSTNTLPNHLLSKAFWTLAPTWGINLFGTDPRYQKNEHRSPVYSGCDQSVLISHITLANNSSILPVLRLCYVTSDWWHLMGSWLKMWASCTCGSWKVAPAGCPAAQRKGRTLGKPLLVTLITHSRAPLPTASLRHKIVSRQKKDLLLSCSGGLAKQTDRV